MTFTPQEIGLLLAAGAAVADGAWVPAVVLFTGAVVIQAVRHIVAEQATVPVTTAGRVERGPPPKPGRG